MTPDEQRKIENYALSRPLSEIYDRDMLAFLAALIQGHDHFREKLMTEPNQRSRREKYEAMRPHLSFRALPLDQYLMAEMAHSCGVQPIYAEQDALEKSRLWMPTSRVHEVRE